MDKFYETNELSDVICDNCTKFSVTTKKPNFEKETVLKAPMQLRISLQRSHYNVENNIFYKNKTKIALPAQYSMSFPNEPKVIYILVSIKCHIGNDMDQGHYLCDVLDYNTGTWWNCDDDIITEYSGYPMNVYNDLSSDKKQKIGKRYDMDVSERIVSTIYIRKDILSVRTHYFITGKSI